MIGALLPPDLSAGVFALLTLASFGTSAMTAALGLGGGALMLALMASVLPGAVLIPVHGLVQLGSNAGRFWMLRRAVAWRPLRVFALGSVVGVALGGLIAVDLDDALVRAGVGLFILYGVLANPPRWMGRWPALTGVLSSFLTMFFGATGPFVATGVKALGLNRLAHVGTHAAMMTLQHGFKTLAFGLLGFVFAPWVWLIGALILSGMAGTWAGTKVLARQSDRGFQRALNAVLVVLALNLIWQALTG